MRATKILQRLVERAEPHVHAARLAAVTDVVDAIIHAKHVSLTAIGRALRGNTTPRHGIKKVDRLLGNWRLHQELLLFYRCLALYLLRAQKRAIILIDWTQLRGDFWSLTGSVPFLGRSIPILSRSFTHDELNSRRAHEQFLDELRKVLPTGTKAVIVADGGFRSPFFKACFYKGFDYVIRLRNDHSVANFGEENIPFCELFARATNKARCLGGGLPYASSQHAVGARIILGPRPPKAMRRKKYMDDYERKRGCEPFLLATTLENDAAETIVRIYAARMQIEETFRDTKNGRSGWGLEHSGTKSTRRFDVLLMLAALAFTVVALVGAAARELGHEAKFRARSGSRAVLSVITLGTLVLRSRQRLGIRFHAVWRQLKGARRLHRSYFPRITPPRSGGRNVSLPLPHVLFCADCGWRGRGWGWPE